MRKNVLEFFRRGCMACGLGPVVLAVVYLALQKQGLVELLTVREVCSGIFSLTALAFLCGGMGVIYAIERLPLMAAILIHGGVLFVGYLITYRVNGWLEEGAEPVFVFTWIFVIGYLLIWAGIYLVTRMRTTKVNETLKKQQEKI